MHELQRMSTTRRAMVASTKRWNSSSVVIICCRGRKQKYFDFFGTVSVLHSRHSLRREARREVGAHHVTVAQHSAFCGPALWFAGAVHGARCCTTGLCNAACDYASSSATNVDAGGCAAERTQTTNVAAKKKRVSVRYRAVRGSISYLRSSSVARLSRRHSK